MNAWICRNVGQNVILRNLSDEGSSLVSRSFASLRMTGVSLCLGIALFSIFSIFCIAEAGSAKTSLTGPLAERFNAVSDRLICQCGCKMILGVCNHQNCPSGIPMRQEIEKQLSAGASDDTIVNAFVASMGKVVLSEPPAKGVYLLAWILPFLSLIMGGIGIFLWLRAQNKKNKKTVLPTEKLNPEDEEKFKKEWDKWNQQP